jgi:hypothetical protein
MLAGQLALVLAAIFTGAAVYITIGEQPARLALEDQALLGQWKPAYKRGFAMQAPLATTGFLLGVLAWWWTGQWPWLGGAIALVLNWPYTLFFIGPTNRRLMAMAPASAGSTSRSLIRKWGRLHIGRGALGLAATTIFLWASMR